MSVLVVMLIVCWQPLFATVATIMMSSASLSQSIGEEKRTIRILASNQTLHGASKCGNIETSETVEKVNCCTTRCADLC
ncbi:unnamed protein product [Amoebophrya sp. A25]|nr:unnamed protein product [Amoebophrya sp. A25]|eukprot:GSA25T00004574001.1